MANIIIFSHKLLFSKMKIHNWSIQSFIKRRYATLRKMSITALHCYRLKFPLAVQVSQLERER